MVSALTSTFYNWIISCWRVQTIIFYYWIEYIILFILIVSAAVRFEFSNDIVITNRHFSSSATIFILHRLHITVGVPKTELGTLPLIGSSRRPFSPGTHPQPLQGSDFTDSKSINSILSEGTKQPINNIYQYIDSTKLAKLNHYLPPSVQQGLSIRTPSIPNKAIGLIKV